MPKKELAIGAKVTVEFHDRSALSRFVLVGDDYLTQLPPAVFVPVQPKSLDVHWPAVQVSKHRIAANIRDFRLSHLAVSEVLQP